MKLTIFTPTYNRVSTIVRTYQSLLQQTSKEFEWLIVDDGSTDDTEKTIKLWMNRDNGFPIRYIKQPNGGKYRAYNTGLRNAQGDLFFCVDSDDWLPVRSVELILKRYNKLMDDNTLVGIVALKEYPDKKLIGHPYSGKVKRASLYTLELLGEGGERSLVFKTNIARQFPFPEATNEKFMGELIVYDRFHNLYDFFICNDILTTCEYQEEGLSSNPHALMLRNPAGYKLYYAQRIDMAQSLNERISYILRYHAFGLLSGGKQFQYCGRHKWIVNVLSPFGYFLAVYYKLNK